MALGVINLKSKVDKYEGFNPVFPGVDTVDFSGVELGSTPGLQANLRMGDEFDIASGLYKRVSGDLSYTDDYFSGLELENPEKDRFRVDGYTLANARLALGNQAGSWEVAGWVRNIGDKYYYHSATFSDDAITQALGMGRTYGVSLTVNWQEIVTRAGG